MSTQHGSLHRAMRIHGAHSITVIGMANGRPEWSAAADDKPADELGAALAASLVGAAEQLVRLTDGGQHIEDLLIASPTYFHIFCLVPEPDGAYVVHLVLDRHQANLAMARRELRAVVEVDRANQRDSRTTPAVSDEPTPSSLGPLPRRDAGQTLQRLRTEGPTPTWHHQYADEPFTSDTPILDRVVEGLRRLR